MCLAGFRIVVIGWRVNHYENRCSIENDTVSISYGAKHKWHADQVKTKIDDLTKIVEEQFGSNFTTKLIMPDGAVITSDLPF
jgi:hypothetical protein